MARARIPLGQTSLIQTDSPTGRKAACLTAFRLFKIRRLRKAVIMGKIEDLAGKRFGALTVIKQGNTKTSESGRKQICWVCACDCGNEVTVQANNLKSGHTISCGCAKDRIGEKLFHDLSGQRFGRLTVVEQAERSKAGEIRWRCRCDCGREIVTQANNLTSGSSKSCGCWKHEKLALDHTTHGGRKTRLYSIWVGMRRRCYEETSVSYKNYGGRGISICDEWRNDFSAFRAWALKNGYDDSLSIDRINNDWNYEPRNCRWATPKEQAANRRKRRKKVL